MCMEKTEAVLNATNLDIKEWSTKRIKVTLRKKYFTGYVNSIRITMIKKNNWTWMVSVLGAVNMKKENWKNDYL